MAKPGLPVSKLMVAIRAGNLDAAIKALADGNPVNEADVHGHPGLPLRTACFEGDLAIIDELIRCGADVNDVDRGPPGADEGRRRGSRRMKGPTG